MQARTVIVLAVVATLAGCAGATPTEFQRADDMKPGPGMLSGPTGAFTYSKDLDAERKQAAAGTPAAPAAQTPAAPPPAGKRPGDDLGV